MIFISGDAEFWGVIFLFNLIYIYWASQVVLVVKNPSANVVDVRDAGSIAGSGKSPGGGNSNAL